ncbi:hypothetical protein ACFQYP_36800 [Nonomuraea antimicrobica]
MRIWLLARVHLGPVAVLFVLTLSACLLVAGLPRATQAAYDEALRRALSATPAVQADLTVAVESRSPEEDLHERAQFDSRDRLWREILPGELRPLVTGAGHMSAKTTLTPITGTGGKSYLNLGWLSDGERRVDWVRGRAPARPPPCGTKARRSPCSRSGSSRRPCGRWAWGWARRRWSASTTTPPSRSSAPTGPRIPATATGRTTPTSCTSPRSSRPAGWTSRSTSPP